MSRRAGWGCVVAVRVSASVLTFTTEADQDPTTVYQIRERHRNEEVREVLSTAVHKELGSGFLERLHQEALVLELRDRGIAFGCEVEVNVHYKGRLLTCSYRADMICFPDDVPVLVELKACERLTHAHRAQVIHDMKATRIQRALLRNFGGPAPQFERMVLGWDG